MKSCLEALALGEVLLNEHNNIHKSFQELIQKQQEHLKIQQEKQQPSFQLVIDKKKFIDRIIQLSQTPTYFLDPASVFGW